MHKLVYLPYHQRFDWMAQRIIAFILICSSGYPLGAKLFTMTDSLTKDVFTVIFAFWIAGALWCLIKALTHAVRGFELMEVASKARRNAEKEEYYRTHGVSLSEPPSFRSFKTFDEWLGELKPEDREKINVEDKRAAFLASKEVFEAPR